MVNKQSASGGAKLEAQHPSIETPRSILILKPSSFGDIVHTLPAVARLKDAWPTSRITWLVNPEWASLLDGNADLAGRIEFPRHRFRGVVGWYRFARWCQLRAAGLAPELTLDFQGLLRTALVGRASKPNTFYGMSDAREGARWFYDRVARIPKGPVHAVDRYLALVEQVLGDRFRPTPSRFSLPSGEVVEHLKGRLEDGFVLLHPYARGDGKSLTEPQIERLCRRLAPRQVVLVGRRSGGRPDLPASAVDLVNETSLLQLIWVIRQATCVVSVDSGPSHLAAALDKPLVAIHTWSDPRRVGPYREDAWVWKNNRLLLMRHIREQDETFFKQAPQPLSTGDIDAIGDLAISLSRSCA